MIIPAFILDRFTYLAEIDPECDCEALCLKVPLQEDTLWCWAAVAVGVANFYHDYSAQQHTIASAVLGEPCLPNGKNSDCHCSAYLEDALCVHDNFRDIEIPLNFDLIRREICSGSPVCALMKSKTSNHFVVIRGFDARFAGYEEVHIADPQCVRWTGPYSTFVSSYQTVYSWAGAYSTKPASQAKPQGSTPCH